MMRRFQRFDLDGRTHDVWINDTAVAVVTPSSTTGSVIEFVSGHTIKVKGESGDVAKELNGYWDEN